MHNILTKYNLIIEKNQIDKLYSISAQIAFAGSNFILAFMLGKFLTIEMYANYAIAMSVGLVADGFYKFLCTTPFNIDPKIANNVTEYGYIICITLFMVLVPLIILGYVCSQLDFYSYEIYELSILYIIFFCIFSTWRVWLNRLKNARMVFLFNCSYFAIVLFFSCACHFNFILAMHFFSFMWIYVISLLFAFVVITFKRQADFKKVNFYKLYNIKSVTGGMLNSMLYSCFNHLPIILLSHFIGAQSTGNFYISRTLTQPLMAIIRGITLIDQKHLAEFTPNNSNNSIYGLVLDQIKRNFNICIIVTLFSFGFGMPLINNLYGEKYSVTILIAVPWVIFSIAVTIYRPLESLLFYLNKRNMILISKGFGAVFSIALSFYIITDFEEIGAVYIVLIGWIITLLSTVYYVFNCKESSDDFN